MNTTDDGDEPVGEFSELSIPRVVSLLDRQTQALNEIRETVEHLLGEPRQHQGVRQAAQTFAAILERNGLT
ncbi:hypothetical protein [Mycolicibacter heraklionensis]|uniref:hypothetical protein n=1 Tax=Mycolicibacter heraklionensis TaxID=512402 RepID=UPI000A7081AB|nr:hypothetical protein [Mycolicibacter heraklionensis]